MSARGIPEEFETTIIKNRNGVRFAYFEINRNTIGFEIYEPTGTHTIRWDINRIPSSDHPYHTVHPSQKGGLSNIFNPKNDTIYVTSTSNSPVEIEVEVRKILGGSI